MTNRWHYSEGDKTVGPLNLDEMRIVLSNVSEPRNLRVWRVGFKDWERAGSVRELAALIDKPPPLAKATRVRAKPWAKVIYGVGILMFFMGPLDNSILQAGALGAIFTLDDVRT